MNCIYFNKKSKKKKTKTKNTKKKKKPSPLKRVFYFDSINSFYFVLKFLHLNGYSPQSSIHQTRELTV